MNCANCGGGLKPVGNRPYFRCPYCETYISREDSPPPGRTWFWVVMMVLALGAALFWVLP